MPNPFSSDYVPNPATQVAEPQLAKKAAVTEAAPAPPVVATTVPETNAYGFEPRRYGLGKPRRVVVRGKVAVG